MQAKKDVKKNKVRVVKKVEARLVYIQLFGFKGSDYTISHEIEKFFLEHGYKKNETVLFNLPPVNPTSDQNSLICIITNERNFRKKIGAGLLALKAISGTPVHIIYLPDLFFFSLTPWPPESK